MRFRFVALFAASLLTACSSGESQSSGDYFPPDDSYQQKSTEYAPALQALPQAPAVAPALTPSFSPPATSSFGSSGGGMTADEAQGLQIQQSARDVLRENEEKREKMQEDLNEMEEKKRIDFYNYID